MNTYKPCLPCFHIEIVLTPLDLSHWRISSIVKLHLAGVLSTIDDRSTFAVRRLDISLAIKIKIHFASQCLKRMQLHFCVIESNSWNLSSDVTAYHFWMCLSDILLYFTIKIFDKNKNGSKFDFTPVYQTSTKTSNL